MPGRDHPLTSLVVDVGTDASAPTDHQLPRMTSHLAMRRTRGLTREDQVALRTIGLGPHDDHRDACLRIAPSPLSWRVGLDVRLRPRKRALAPVRLDPTAAARSTPLPRVSSRLGHPNPSRPCGHEDVTTRDAYDRRLPITLERFEHPTCVWLPRSFRAFARRLVVPGAVHDALSASAIRRICAWAFSSALRQMLRRPASDVPSSRWFISRARFRVRAMPPRPRSLPPVAP